MCDCVHACRCAHTSTHARTHIQSHLILKHNNNTKWFYSSSFRDEEDEEDLVGKSEEDFWASISQEKKDIEDRERKRQEAMAPKKVPTPIPEEGAEPGEMDDEVRKWVWHMRLLENSTHCIVQLA